MSGPDRRQLQPHARAHRAVLRGRPALPHAHAAPSQRPLPLHPDRYPDFGAADAIDLVQRFRSALLAAALTDARTRPARRRGDGRTVHPVQPPGIIIDPVPIGPATGAFGTRAAARLRPIDAVRAIAPRRRWRLRASPTPAAAPDPAPAQTEASRASWGGDPAISRAMRLIGRPILRPGAATPGLPEEALLVGIDFDGIDAARVHSRSGRRPPPTARTPVSRRALGGRLRPGDPAHAISGISDRREEGRRPAPGRSSCAAPSTGASSTRRD